MGKKLWKAALGSMLMIAMDGAIHQQTSKWHHHTVRIEPQT